MNSLLGLSVANIPSVNSLHSIYMAGYVGRRIRRKSERESERERVRERAQRHRLLCFHSFCYSQRALMIGELTRIQKKLGKENFPLIPMKFFTNAQVRSPTISLYPHLPISFFSSVIVHYFFFLPPYLYVIAQRNVNVFFEFSEQCRLC